MMMQNNFQPSRVLVTGASGFVGRALCSRLTADGYEVIGTVRNPSSSVARGIQKAIIGDIQCFDKWANLLDGVTAVFHLAARVHELKDRAKDPLADFRRTNVEGTYKLLLASVAGGIRRFIYLSTAKVHGEGRETAYSEADALSPQDPYAISKAEAEQKVCSVGARGDLETIIIRPPMVYGPNVKANFLKLIYMARWHVPLPLASVDNRRSLVFIENIVDFMVHCLTHPKAANNAFLISDGNNISTGSLYLKISEALGTKGRLFHIPPTILIQLGRLTGKTATVDRLCGSLMVNSSKAREILCWQPPVTIDQGIQKTIDWYLRHEAK
jgi:nucleoside-diphosphate-sugar epimerase